MRDFFARKNIKRFLITLSVIIFVCILSNIDKNSILSSALNALTNSMQGVSAYAADAVNNKSYDDLKAENEQLRKENANYRAQLIDYFDVKQDNAKLLKYYELKQNNPSYELMPASVIRRDPNDEFYSFTIDKGKTSGIQVNNAVVTENGLIGWVSEVDATTAKISTILSVDAKVGAIDKVTKDSGVVTGSLELAKSNLTALTKISASHKIKPGDIIVSTGISGLYPSNLVIGEVKELDYNAYDTSLYAIIEPYENVQAVSDVVVITNFTGKDVVLSKEESKENADKIADVTVPSTTKKQTETTAEE